MPTHWTLRQSQEEIKKFRRRKFPLWEEQSIQVEVLDLVAEAGKFLHEYTRFQEKRLPDVTEGVKKGLGDILYSLICVANKLNISLQHCLDESLVIYHYDLQESAPQQGGVEHLNLTVEQSIRDIQPKLNAIMEDIDKGILLDISSNKIIGIIIGMADIVETCLKVTNYGRALNKNTEI